MNEVEALQKAREADAEIAQGKYKGPLHGIPYGLKDLFATKTMHTTWGAKPYQEQQFDFNATVVEKLDSAGAVLVAKLSLGALANGDIWFGGMTRNPWDTEKGSSGSSAGSAAAVSAGLVPFAIGTETLGSIVSPSTVCGVTGLRPTFGRVSRYGAMNLSWSMDKIGPIARSAKDCALVLEAMAGLDLKDPATVQYPLGNPEKTEVKKLKIGYLKKDFEKEYPFKENDLKGLKIIDSLGFELIPLSLPEYPYDLLMQILFIEAATAFDELTRSNSDDQLVQQGGENWPNLFRAYRFFPAVEYLQLNRLRTNLIQDMFALMQEIDLLISPSWEGDCLTATNLTGQPSITVPNGFYNNTPSSFTFVGKLYNEASLLAFADLFQQHSTYHKNKPPLFDINK